MTEQPSGTERPADPLRIIHCFRAPVGGVFRHVRDLALAQQQHGHAVGIICDSTTGTPLTEQTLASMEPPLQLGLRRLAMRRQISPSDLTATYAIYREVRAHRPHIVHGHGAKGGAYARMIGTLLRASGIRVARIYTPHGGSLHYDRTSLKGGAYLRLERLLESMSDGLIFVSAFERDAYTAKVGRPKKPFVVVHNGLAEDEFDPVEPAPSAGDFLFVGTLRDLKGPDIFIDALALLHDRIGRKPTAVMVGDGDIAAAQARAASRGLADSISFCDPMPTRQAFALGHALVVPSRAESLPYIILEAAAANLPVIATDVGGIREILPVQRLVPPESPEALAEALAVQLDAPEIARAAAAELRAEIRPRFTIDSMAENIEAMYRRVLSSDTKRAG